MKPNLLIRAALKLTGYTWSLITVAQNPFTVTPEQMIVIWRRK